MMRLLLLSAFLPIWRWTLSVGRFLLLLSAIGFVLFCGCLILGALLTQRAFHSLPRIAAPLI